MSQALSPLYSEFDTAEQEASYTQWLRAKVDASLSDAQPAIPHDEVMSEIELLIQAAEKPNKQAA
ncbi:MAG: hypothetical protein AB7S56_01000 [Halothiobacillaceae bacterium]